MATESKKIKFEITTPERTVLTTEILKVTIPTKKGEITVLPGHIPIVASLVSGVMEVTDVNGELELIAVSGGFLTIMPENKVVVLADTAERAPEIDAEKAEEARRMAEEERERQKTEQFDMKRFTDVNASISKQLARERAASKWRKLKG
jgi:F-type H+-transporting ATPase subunit epsilon